MMMRLARNLENGIEPAILSDPNLFRAVPLQTTSPEAISAHCGAKPTTDAYRRAPTLA